ncbi:hypothetical protein FDUTEX481_10089 [Tolypothrix sp. PCC 7601]|nr:hypothetical protein FDUTEX481_10089 [Tolypothrix sp. PCC 7601]
MIVKIVANEVLNRELTAKPLGRDDSPANWGMVIIGVNLS